MPQDGWGNDGGVGWGTWLVLRNRRHGGNLVEEFVHHRVSRPCVDASGDIERVYHILLTEAGRASYQERWAVNHAEYRRSRPLILGELHPSHAGSSTRAALVHGESSNCNLPVRGMSIQCGSMPLALLFLGLIVALVGLGVLGSSILPRFRPRWKRRVGQGLGGVLSGIVLFVVGSILLPSSPAPSAVPTPSPTTAPRTADSLPSNTTPEPTAAEPAPAVVARTPQPGQVLLTYVEGAHDGSAYRSSEELQDGLRNYTWDTVPGVAGGLVLYAVPARRSQVYMAQLSDVTAPDEAFLGTAPRQVGETELNRAFCVTDGPLAGTLVDVTHLTDGSKQVQVSSEAYRQLRNLRPEIRCPA